MATAEISPESASPADQLEGQTYEIIRNRLVQQGQDLRTRLNRLNEARKDVFGSIETELLSTDRITTENNCVPRDMVAIGQQFLFGYNVHLGLRKETKLDDVFSLYGYSNRQFQPRDLSLLADEQFELDFQELYKYYKETQFAKFAVIGPYLFMAFRVGRQVSDVKTFKWLIEGDTLRYVGNRSDHEYRFPPQHEFEWKRATRDMHQSGLHPHISIEERVFVETVGGDLTIKVENNTDSGEGIYAEPVENADQTLDDAEIHYASVGNLILLKIRPYMEEPTRYIVFNEKVQDARRIDAIADACVLLPDGHGLIFPQGYYLQTGEYKTFETSVSDMVFERRVASPNGEDYLYVFVNRLEGVYVLLSYNLISQVVGTPTVCSGYAFFDNGEALTFRHHADPQKHHAVQIWQTPYTSPEFNLHVESDSLLFKIGNKDLVRGMAECYEILNLIAKEDTYADLYIDIVKHATDLLDSYFWIDDPGAQKLAEPLQSIREAAQAAISEFDKVNRIRKNTAHETEAATRRTREIVSAVQSSRFDTISDFVHLLGELRKVRGEVISLRDLRYVDTEHVDRLEEEVSKTSDRLAQQCVEFLLRDDSLVPYEQRVSENHDKIAGLAKVAEAQVVEENITAAADELEMLIDIVSNLKIDDATQRTKIIDDISAIFAGVNRTRATLKNKKEELMSAEGAAEFASLLKLLNQAVVNYLDVCDTPEKCEEYLTKLMIQVEELEGRFSEFDEMLEQLHQKREEVYNAFEARKLQLVEARNRRANTLQKSADRILKGIQTRVESLESVNEINGYFASDLMVDKVRDIIDQLGELDDAVKVDDIQSRLKTIREDAVRQLKDRQELFVDGQNVIQLGRHKFSVNVQALDLTTVMHDGELAYHLTGTNFIEPVAHEALLATRDVWSMEVPSENEHVYRAEFLAWQILRRARRRSGEVPTLEGLAELDDGPLEKVVQQYMAPRYAEGYVKGVHDHDATKILEALVGLATTIGLLRYDPSARMLAWLFWNVWSDDERKPVVAARMRGFGEVTSLFPESEEQADCIEELAQHVGEFVDQHWALRMLRPLAAEAGEYLFYVLAGDESFVISGDAERILTAFHDHVESKAYAPRLDASLAELDGNRIGQLLLARDWVEAFVEEIEASPDDRAFRDEVAQLLVEREFAEGRVIHTSLFVELEEMLGSHARIEGGRYKLNYNEFAGRLEQFETRTLPAFESYQKLKREVVEIRREELRLDEFRPRVLTSFVRNKLLDHVYLPLIGDNLAKQLGTAGEGKRTDRMGLLLLISPPGYGKTTLMEYIANRLGLIFMKINGPALGHQVSSLDPAAAPNAAAREEVEKLNLSLEMGDNVMIYLDDIQHVNPEFLQKFISLCDATRKIEGVFNGKTRTYDLRGKKVCVVMAGNPYTESGERFQIPDMLANRADTYNLGEIIGDSREWFEMSYLENAMTSNPVLSHVASSHPADIHAIIKMAQTGSQEVTDLEGNYALDELRELVDTMQKLIRARDIVLSVNREYIRSAAQSDDYRTEPPFKLQGSYRNMNRIAERVAAVMNDSELKTLILSQYEQDAQTLTTGAEANLLKFKHLCDWATPEERQRWDDICRTFCKNQKLRGIDPGDRFGQVIAEMGIFSDGLTSIRDAVVEAAAKLEEPDEEAVDATASQLGEMAAMAGQFSSGLDAIQKTLDTGLTKLGTQAVKRAGETRPVLATFAPDAMEILTKFVAELQLAAAARQQHPSLPSEVYSTGPTPSAVDAAVTGGGRPQPAAGPARSPSGEEGPYRVEVVNRIPRVFLSIIREQFRLMQQWMEPLTRATEENRAGFNDLQQQLAAAMEKYDSLIDELVEDGEAED